MYEASGPTESLLELPDWVPKSPRKDAALQTSTTSAPNEVDVASESTLRLLSPNGRHDDTGSTSGTSYQSQARQPSLKPDLSLLIDERPIKYVMIPPDEDRIAKRELTSWQLFMITLNGTLGTGLYWAGGRMLEVGGPVAATLSFGLVGVLAWLVMQCITEMLCLWPVPGALSVYVSTFVDEDLGITVGIAYWFTYSVSFSALISSVSEEMGFWQRTQERQIRGPVIFLLLPVIIILLNWFRIKIYGTIESAVGTIKVIFYFTIAALMFSIAVGAGGKDGQKRYVLDSGATAVRYDPLTSNNWAIAFINCMFEAAFSYVGVEIIAAAALEAGWTRSQEPNDKEADQGQTENVSKTIRRASKWFPVAIAIAYTVGMLLVSLVVPPNHCDLPRESFIQAFACVDDDLQPRMQTSQTSTSPFTIAARMSGIPHLDDVVNAFLVFTAIFCASTNLYVASRTLFALTNNIQGGPQQRLSLRMVSKLGKTNRQKVPLRSVMFSALAFAWVPALQLIPGIGESYGKFTEVLAGMGSVGVVIVWFCNVIAYIRFFYAQRRFKAQRHDELEKYFKIHRDHSEYPYKAHQQPHFAWIALVGCLFILLVASSASIWKDFHSTPFLTAYLAIFCFILLWLLLKFKRSGQWFVKLSTPEQLAKKFRRLEETRYRALERGVRKSRKIS